MKSTVLTLLAAVTLTFVLGSIHAFSVFLLEFESVLDAPRGQVSMIYSISLFCLTVSVLFGHRIFPLLNAPILALCVCIVAAAGTYLSGQSQSFTLVLLGYGVLFGGANGIGYGFALQISAQAMPHRKGIAMGTVTAFYAFGATVFPSILKSGLSLGGLAMAMALTSGILLFAGAFACTLLVLSGVRYRGEKPKHTVIVQESSLNQILLWLGYGFGSAAGLMIIGHATGIVLWAGGSVQQSISGLTLVAMGNMLGGLVIGWLSDHVPLKSVLVALPVGSGLAAAVLATATNYEFLLIGLCLTGFCYGAIIAVYPVAVSTLFGEAASSRIYGRVFTAWGLAGLIGPWIAGSLFERSQHYTLPLLVASAASLISIAAISLLPGKFELKD